MFSCQSFYHNSPFPRECISREGNIQTSQLFSQGFIDICILSSQREVFDCDRCLSTMLWRGGECKLKVDSDAFVRV